MLGFSRLSRLFLTVMLCGYEMMMIRDRSEKSRASQFQIRFSLRFTLIPICFQKSSATTDASAQLARRFTNLAGQRPKFHPKEERQRLFFLFFVVFHLSRCVLSRRCWSSCRMILESGVKGFAALERGPQRSLYKQHRSLANATPSGFSVCIKTESHTLRTIAARTHPRTCSSDHEVRRYQCILPSILLRRNIGP